MALTALQLLEAFPFGYGWLGFDSEADAVTEIGSANGILAAALAEVQVPVQNALKGRAVSVEAALAVIYPDSAEAQTATLAVLNPLLTAAETKYGLALLYGSVPSQAREWLERSNEARISANQTLAKAIALIEGFAALLTPNSGEELGAPRPRSRILPTVVRI